MEKQVELLSNSGILDCGFKCINSVLNVNPVLEEYELKAVTFDTDSQGLANVILTNNGEKYHGKAYDIDVVLASLNAYFNACLKINN